MQRNEGGGKMTIKERLEYLKQQIEKECISYGEIAELQSLKKHIKKYSGDIVLAEWAGIKRVNIKE